MISASSAWLTAAAKPNLVPIYVVEIDGYHYGFSNGIIPGVSYTAQPWLVGIDDHVTTVDDLNGAASIADLVFHVQDRGNLITADFPSTVFEGKKVVLKGGWGHLDPLTGEPVSDLAIADFVTFVTAKIDSVESENSNNDYVFTCPDIRTELLQSIFLTGDDGFPISDQHPKTLDGHPLDILLEILETEIGIDPADIDTALIAAYKEVFSGWLMQFTLTSSEEALEFISKEICMPLGAYHWTNNLGQFTLSFAYPLDVATVFDFTRDNLQQDDIPGAGQADLINQVTTRMDYDGQDFLQQPVQEYTPSITKYGLYGGQIIESKGMRSGLNGIFFGSFNAFMLFLRYGDKQLMFGDNGKSSSSNPANALWSAALVEPGDLVTMTHDKVPDRTTGTMGITGKTFVTLDRTWQWFAGNVQFKLLAIDLSKFKPYLITANGEADYVSASSGDKATLMFLCGDDDKYSNGDPGNTLC